MGNNTKPNVTLKIKAEVWTASIICHAEKISGCRVFITKEEAMRLAYRCAAANLDKIQAENFATRDFTLDGLGVDLVWKVNNCTRVAQNVEMLCHAVNVDDYMGGVVFKH